ncbi:MAG TPA: hypothetical protein VJ111_14155, partial [Chitinophagaceae bacterium]|nr:hypothetical protein [Chitinophagaceae bacterium]
NYQDENIDLVREADMASLIHYAEKCFSFFSTLIIPIVFHKRNCYLFQIGDELQMQKELVELGVSRKLDTENFTEKELTLSHEKIDDDSYQLFIKRYLYYTDGKSTERLKKVLVSV